MSIRQIEGEIVLRLWLSEADANRSARLLQEPGWLAVLHDSKTGWLLINERTGRRRDDAGLIDEPRKNTTSN